MDIGEEHGRVLLDLADLKSFTGVGLGTGGVDASAEGSGQAADAAADILGALNRLGVGE